MSQERLQRYLARSGVASRRASEQLIVDGRVRVNGTPVTILGTVVDPAHDRVEVDRRVVAPTAQRVYIALHKPAGVVSTAHDPQGRPTVVDLVRSSTRIYPVGRLDAESEGLLLLTDDGDLAMQLTHPRYGVEKEYRVLVRGPVGWEDVARLARGVSLDGRITAPAEVTLDGQVSAGTWLCVTIHEGRNRQIRRMAAEIGLEVLRLIRVRVGTIRLGNMAPGTWRQLSDTEVRSLRKESE